MTREECIERLQEIVDQDKNKILVRVHVGYLIHAIKYLKEQEAVKPIKPIYQVDDSYICDNCGEIVGWEEIACCGIDQVKYKYCPGCGRRVKWDADD